VEIRPLTVLAGAHSSGKSSIIQPLLLMKQTLESPSDQGALALDGPNVPFTSAEQLLARSPAGNEGPVFEVEVAELGVLSRAYDRAPTGVFGIRELRDHLRAHPTSGEPEGSRLSNPLREMLAATAARGLDQGDRLLNDVLHRVDTFDPVIRSVIHLPGLRGTPERLYPRRVVQHGFRGRFEDYTASVIAHWEETRDANLLFLGRQLREMGLTAGVRAERVLDTAVEVKVARRARGSGEDEWFSLADVGLGVSQVLPVLVALLAARPGQLVFLEQPELHLHPRAQVALAPILARAATLGRRVVVETHSSLLLLALQTLVARGKLAPDLLALHWFRREPRIWQTRVTWADVDETGAFGEWPEDFDEVELDAQRDYLDAVGERQRAAAA